MMSKKTTAIGLLAATVVLTGLAAQASAQEATQTNTRRVSYAGLNLAHEPDARVLLQRIRRAAHQVCEGSGGWAEITSTSYHRCVRKAQSDAVASLNSPTVTAVYQGKPTMEVAGK